MYKEIALLSLAAVITKISQMQVDKVTYKHEKPLFDLLHTKLPNLKRYERYIDLVPILLILTILYLYVHDGLDELLIKYAISTYAILLIIRAAFFSVTVFPSPFCTKRVTTLGIGGCRDCIFSGHAVLMLLLAYVLFQHNPEYKVPLLIYCILGCLFIISSRAHYTIDVLVAGLIVYAISKWPTDWDWVPLWFVNDLYRPPRQLPCPHLAGSTGPKVTRGLMDTRRVPTASREVALLTTPRANQRSGTTQEGFGWTISGASAR